MLRGQVCRPYWTEGAGQAGEYSLRDGSTVLGVFTATGTRLYWNQVSATGEVFGRTGTGSYDTRYYLKDHLGTAGTGSPGPES